MANAGIATNAAGTKGQLTFGGAVVAEFDGTGITSGAPSSYRNRIINGRMEIDQIRAGTAVTPVAGFGYLIDQVMYSVSQASKLTFQQVVDAPAGFKNSMKVSVAAQYSPIATDAFVLVIPVEAKDVIDFSFGTASAAVVTLSQQIKGSVAGTYAVSIRNGAGNRSYVGTINVTTSWAPVSITLTGDTTGTWATDNTLGIQVSIDLGSGTNFNTTAGAWQAGNFLRTAGSITFVNQVAGSTLNITGVQLEKGSAPTASEYRMNELQLCQRYYQTQTVSIATNATVIPTIYHKVTMRAAPTIGGAIGAGWTTISITPDSTIGYQTTASNASNLTFAAQL